VKRAKGPAKASAQWKKEVARARERVRRGWIAAIAHGGLFLIALALVSVGSPAPGEAWARAGGIAAVLFVLAWLLRRGSVVAALLLFVGAVGTFIYQLVANPGLHLNLASILFAWFYFEGLRGTLALSRRLHAPTIEPD
jgi:hypothetical protein